MKVTDLPALNASLNALCTVWLLAGWVSVRRGAQKWHRIWMTAAVVTSAAFLSSYLIYHFNTTAITRYAGSYRWLYFPILATHVPLAAVMVPFIFVALYWAHRGDNRRHTRITRWLWPTWLYVSVTGVLIYLMLWVPPFNA